ncbi:substrate-binding periplasmic protein [Shewanella aquimarina]|uniref:substrate-binding periplasmic protein n=1 Tax=Shewanella aquimarina TaxID=260365 RepID=UPI002014D7A7|nr:transporter substrate-binding domain-containing protein [Shewanella aquimarina]MCL2909760.1 transporter substrate-binding domain-containing protein [Shewanella aquimarina]
MRKLLLASGFILFSNPLLAHAANTEITFAVSNTIPPYFFANGQSGIQYERLTAVLARQSLSIGHIHLSPNKRAFRQVASGNVDCLINAPENLAGLYYTRSLISYQNSVFTLASNKLLIDSVSDLAAISVMGFQNATQYLGKDFYQMALNNPQYGESNSQKSQVMMLFSGRVEAIILEGRIFEYYREQLKFRVDTLQATVRHPLFAPAPRKIACHSQAIAEKIDLGIAQLDREEAEEKSQSIDSAPEHEKMPVELK